MKKLFITLFLCLFACVTSKAVTTPVIFFTDLDSGPNSGGESVSSFAGSYVTVYGNNFGATQGGSTITWNGLSCLRVVSWGTSYLWYQTIVVQFGSSCTAGTGTFTVTVGGIASVNATVGNFNGATLTPSTFTVRSGNIFCVASGGSDVATGKFPSSCWATIQHALDNVASGDIAYVETLTSGDNCAQYNAANCIQTAGASGNPKAVVAYPGATVTINTSQGNCIRTPAISGPGPFWTLAGFTCTASFGFTLTVGSQRVVGNSFSCPAGNGLAACVEEEGGNNFFYGNVMNNAGAVGASKTYHGVYFSGTDDHSDLAWNDIHNVRGCRGMQFYQSGGPDVTDIHVHDNLIHDTVCDGVNFSTVNPSTGPIEAYNNVLYSVGKGPGPPDGSSVYACFDINAISAHTGTVQIYNNTCLNAGSNGDATSAGSIVAFLSTQLRNNIFYQNNGFPYLSSGSGCTDIAASSANNDFFGNGAAPTCSGNITGSLNVDPKVVSIVTPDFHLQLSSPMIGAGTASLFPPLDHDALIRASPPSVGAYEYISGTVNNPTAPSAAMFAGLVNQVSGSFKVK
jgi:hypothetical protein